MRAPPPVSVQLGPDHWWRRAQGWLAATALGVTVYWGVCLLDAPVWLGGIAWASIGLLGVMLSRPRSGADAALRLAFDGEHWVCRPAADPGAGSPCQPRVAIDLGVWMLLRIDIVVPVRDPGWRAALRRAASRRWVAASRSDAGAQWKALRVALYCSAGEPA